MFPDFANSGEESSASFGKPHKKKKKKSKGGDEDFATGWVERNVADAPEGFGVGLGDGAESSQAPEARNPRRVSFSEDPPESRTFSKTDFDTGAGVGAWPEETSPTKPDAAQNLHPEELCWNCGKTFDHWDSVFCRHCGAKRGSPAAPNTPSLSEAPTLTSHSGPTRPLERRFSFSLMDMADGRGQGGLRTGWHTGLQAVQTGLAGSPYLPGSEPIRESLESQKWNPLDGVRCHWQPRDEEFRRHQVQSDDAGPHLLTAMRSGSIVEEVQKAEQRLQGLQQKISNLESSLSRDSWPTGGRVAVSLAADGDLGIALHGLTISGITDPQLAKMAGWAVGDHILQVNGVIVLNPQQLAQELRKAQSAHRAVKRPIQLEIWRPGGNSPEEFGIPSTSQLGQPPRPTGPARSEPITHHWAGPKLSSQPPYKPYTTPELATRENWDWAGPKLLSAPPAYTAQSSQLTSRPSRRRASLC